MNNVTIRLIIGLRNPGPAYEQTRHNAGAWFVERVQKQFGHGFVVDKKHQTQMSECRVDGQTFIAMMPTGFMNHSGRSTLSVAHYYKIAPQEILVAHDELDLDPGRVKLKTGGGHGGHNGLRDIISQLGSADFHRLRIGIGHPGHKDMVTPYVLSQPSSTDKRLIYDALERSIPAMSLIIKGDMAKAMTMINS
jgi:PTH1 family peptidyl-tRNA hydrolase